jgi:ABC-type Fe3+/spermidine/putrescine transport system ATPase subunit
MSRLVISDLDVGYDGVPVVRNLDLTVADGRIAAILGPSGCGKTTLLRAIAGFLRPTKGHLEVGDRIVVGPDTWVPPLRQDIHDLLASTGTTAVLVTHDQEEALSFADQVAVMRDGRIVQSASPDTVYARPADLDVARFVGQLVELPGVADGGMARTALGDLMLVDRTLRGDCVIAVRPEQVVLSTAADATTNGTIDALRFFGHDHLVEVRLADGSVVCARQSGAPRQHSGDAVRVEVRGPVSAFAVS